MLREFEASPEFIYDEGMWQVSWEGKVTVDSKFIAAVWENTPDEDFEPICEISLICSSPPFSVRASYKDVLEWWKSTREKD